MTAPRNRTIQLTAEEEATLRPHLLTLTAPAPLETIQNRVICQDLADATPHLPRHFADLLILDPPYNLTKNFGGKTFKKTDDEAYQTWVESWLVSLLPTLKPTASVYVCGDWQSSPLLYPVLKQHFILRNRITWEREKGRGAKANWKNSSEDIWFGTLGDDYTFNVEAVKLKRKVLAPYRDNGLPKDWQAEETGNFRLTYPSNLWTDISVPFWSMPENTDHPTQKPEKLLAKLILASSNRGDLILDPFLGSGTSAVVAKKLGRRYIGIEQNLHYACLAEKRLALADKNPSIQGYEEGVFWERNSKTMKDLKAE